MSALLQHLKNKHAQLEEQTAALARQCRKHPLHEWRIQIKKWRYALRMLEKADPDFDSKKFLQPYKTLFAAAGAIREIQIQGDLLRQSKDALSEEFTLQYRKLLQQQYRIAREYFSALARETELPDWTSLKKPLRAAVRQCHTLASSFYFQQLQDRIHTDWQDGHQLSDEALHDLRKQLKAYDANRRLLARTIRYEAPTLQFLPGDIDALMEQVGVWHDYSTAIQHLQKDLQSSFFNEIQRAEGRLLLRRWQRTAGKLRAAFHHDNHL